MMPIRWTALACLVSCGLVTAAVAAPRIEAGMIVAKDGRTLYVFDNDVPGSGKSVCVGPCEGVFPPYAAAPGETAKAPWSFVERAGGARQWAYRGKPLYRFYADDKKGTTGGDGMNRNTWHVARP